MSETLENTTAILVGVAQKSAEMAECKRSLDELSRLVDTAGASTYAKVIQLKDSYDARTIIGKGKVQEIKDLASAAKVSLIVFDEELSPAQIRNLENDIGDVTVIDRSMLILDIFALHATSGEGKLQVELAQLKYTAPRLTGKGIELSRQGGGIGSRGPGESKLEIDRRHIHEKTVALEQKLRELEANRAVMRAQRDRSGLAKISVVGYTNAGKSTLLNYLTGANVLSEDKLFATLDPTTRKLSLPSGEQVLITDTVGFIRKLPHHLVKAFKSTLDEVRFADILLIVSDVSDPEAPEHLKVTEEIIGELGAAEKPTVYVFNKRDSVECMPGYVSAIENAVAISAKTGEGISDLLAVIERIIKENKSEETLIIPYSDQSSLSALYNEYTVLKVDYLDTGISVTVVLDAKGKGIYKKYLKPLNEV